MELAGCEAQFLPHAGLDGVSRTVLHEKEE